MALICAIITNESNPSLQRHHPPLLTNTLREQKSNALQAFHLHIIHILMCYRCIVTTTKGTWRKWKIFLIVRRMHSHVHSILIIEIAKRVWKDWKGGRCGCKCNLTFFYACLDFILPLITSSGWNWFSLADDGVEFRKYANKRSTNIEKSVRRKTWQENGNWKEVEGVVAQGEREIFHC